MFHGWTPPSCRAVFSGCCFLSPACGCRFGSGPGRFWVGGVQLWEKKGSDPKITFRQASPSMFWDFGSLHQKHREGGTHCRVRRDGSDGWRSPVPRGDNTGGRGHVLPPPTIRCQSRRQVQNILMHLGVDSVRDATFRRHFSRAVAAASTFVSVVAATSAWCRGTSQRNIASQIDFGKPLLFINACVSCQYRLNTHTFHRSIVHCGIYFYPFDVDFSPYLYCGVGECPIFFWTSLRCPDHCSGLPTPTH